MVIDKVIENIPNIRIWGNNRNIMSVPISCPVEKGGARGVASRSALVTIV